MLKNWLNSIKKFYLCLKKEKGLLNVKKFIIVQLVDIVFQVLIIEKYYC